MTNHFDAADWGKFCVGALSQTIKEFFAIKKDTKVSVERIKIWHPLIKQLNYYKCIHTLAHQFLNTYQGYLFPDNISEYSPASLHKKWEAHYENGFKIKIENFKCVAKSVFEMVKDKEGELDTSCGCYSAIEVDFNKFQYHGPAAHKMIFNFISEMERLATNAMQFTNLGNVAAWHKTPVSDATQAVSLSDETIVSLIPIVTFLYEKTISE